MIFLPDLMPFWDVYSSVVLCPLRVQMMGSVVVSLMCTCVKVAKSNQGCSSSIYTTMYVTAGYCRLVNWLLMKDGRSTLGEGLIITLLTLVEAWLCMMMSLCVWL